MPEFIVINGHAPWCAYIRSLHWPEEPCDCSGWDDDDPCRCAAWDPVENDHTKAEHTECAGGPPCGGCDDCISAQVGYYRRRRESEGVADARE